MRLSPNPLVDFALLQSLTRVGPSVVTRRAERYVVDGLHSPGVSSPSAHEVAGSDQHRACLARLCCVFRLSQPLDASFPPKPCWSCFIPAALLGFALQRVSLPNRRRRLSTSPAPPDVGVDVRTRRSSEPAPFPRRRAVSIAAPRSGIGPARESAVGFGRAFRGFSPFRKSVLRSTGISRRWEPILSWVSSLQGVPPRRLDTTAAVSPLLRFSVSVPKQAGGDAPGSRKR